MKVENRVYPDGEQIAALQEAGPDGPIVMVNLLKFRDKALYPDGRDPDLSGREAYDRYAVEVVKLLEAVGGRVLYTGDVTFLTPRPQLRSCGTRWRSPSIRAARPWCGCRCRRNGERLASTARPGSPGSSTSKRFPLSRDGRPRCRDLAGIGRARVAAAVDQLAVPRLAAGGEVPHPAQHPDHRAWVHSQLSPRRRCGRDRRDRPEPMPPYHRGAVCLGRRHADRLRDRDAAGLDALPLRWFRFMLTLVALERGLHAIHAWGPGAGPAAHHPPEHYAVLVGLPLVLIALVLSCCASATRHKGKEMKLPGAVTRRAR